MEYRTLSADAQALSASDAAFFLHHLRCCQLPLLHEYVLRVHPFAQAVLLAPIMVYGDRKRRLPLLQELREQPSGSRLTVLVQRTEPAAGEGPVE